MKLIAPSILSADFTCLGEEIRQVEHAGADWIHIDVMDGAFVPNITYGPIIVDAAKKVTKQPLDVHLMIERPERYIQDFVTAGADWISIHAEVSPHLNRTLQLIKSLGAKAGVALNPSTPLTTIEWVLPDLDYILIMSVNPGFGGQSFIPNSLTKIRRLKEMLIAANVAPLIQIDGGVCLENAREIALAGTDVFVAGSAIFGTKDYQRTITDFKTHIQ